MLHVVSLVCSACRDLLCVLRYFARAALKTFAEVAAAKFEARAFISVGPRCITRFTRSHTLQRKDNFLALGVSRGIIH